MSEKTLYTIIVHSENIAGLLNQVTAVFTRRQINIESLNVSASSIKGYISIPLLLGLIKIRLKKW
ncbi:hypothetical protein BFINE_57010 [Bacteroides finegoldii DSM 17565]|nr:hypothetical protein BFINE_57010 [Bacteroides finegoldii DSM 17565]